MRAVFRDNRIFIYDAFIQKESIKEIPGRLWHPEEKAWSVPFGVDNIETLDLLGYQASFVKRKRSMYVRGWKNLKHSFQHLLQLPCMHISLKDIILLAGVWGLLETEQFHPVLHCSWRWGVVRR